MVSFINSNPITTSNTENNNNNSFNFADEQQNDESGNTNGYGSFSESPPTANSLSTNDFYTSLLSDPNSSITIPPEIASQILAGTNITPPPEGYTFDTEELTEPLTDYINQIGEINKGISDIAYKTAQQQALSSYIDAYIEAEATKKILQMNNQATQANAILDQQQLALRQNYNILSKQTELYVLDAQVREQLTNIFFSLEKTIMDNRFSLAKQVVSSAKY